MDSVETVFSIPHIITAIGANLRLQDLTCCACVNSSWYRLFSFELKLRDGPIEPYRDNLMVDNNRVWMVSRNQSSSQTLVEAWILNMEDISKNVFTLQERFQDTIDTEDSSVGLEQEQGVAQENEETSSSSSPPSSPVADPKTLEDTVASRAYWGSRLSKVRALAHITIHTLSEVENESRRSLMRPMLSHILGRLPSTLVSLDLSLINDWNIKEAILDMTPFEPRVYESLTNLQLEMGGNPCNDKQVLDWFLRQCPVLYDFGYSGTSLFDNLPALDMSQCPSLELVTINGEMEPRQFVSMVHSIPRLVVFNLIASRDLSLVLWQALTPHSSTLESLHLQGAAVSSRVILSILQNCAGLQHFTAEEDGIGHLRAYLDLSDMFSSPRVWACRGLKTLSLHLLHGALPTVTPQENTLFTEEALSELSVNYPRAHQDILRVYVQLSFLTELESLQVFMVRPPLPAEEEGAQTVSLTCKNEQVPHVAVGLDYSIESGLALLSPLKKLRRLEIRTDEGCPEYAVRIRQAEVEWMAENWPSLCEIQYGNKDAYLGETAGPLGWLRKQRPWLKVTHVPRRVIIER